MRAKACNVPVISCMGAGNKLDPTKFRVADIYKTNMCPLAKVMRREMKKRGVKKLKVVYSEEKSIRPLEDMSISCKTHCICPPGAARKCTERRDIPGSIAFVPSVAGLILAGEDIILRAAFGNRNQISFYGSSVDSQGRNALLFVLWILKGNVVPCTAEVSADLELFHIGRNTRI